VSPGEAQRIEIALESLRGTMNSGFATLRGDINLLARGEHNNTRAIDDLGDRVGSLEERRFPLPVLGGILGVVGVLISLVSVIRGG
jgi:hypothetical protein